MTTVYVVTGRDRTGTSMMMRALAIAGLAKPVVSSVVERRIRSRELKVPGYDPNPHGYWHGPDNVLPHHLLVADRPRLIKTQVPLWRRIELGDYQVVRMTRDEPSRRASWEKSFGPYFDPSIYETGEAALLSANLPVVTLGLTELIADPLSAFVELADAGWVFDVEAAAATIDPALYRHHVT